MPKICVQTLFPNQKCPKEAFARIEENQVKKLGWPTYCPKTEHKQMSFVLNYLLRMDIKIMQKHDNQ